MRDAGGMIPFLAVPAQIQEAPALPPGFTLPQGLQVKPGTFQALSYDLEVFEVRPSLEQPPMRIPVKGRTWRFMVEAAGVRAGIFSLQQLLKPALVSAGWVWQWEQRGVARRNQGGQDAWIKVSPSGGSALQLVLVQPGVPRTLTLDKPGPQPEMPPQEGDFPYLTPWPGAKLVASTPPMPGPPVATDLGGGRQGFIGVNWVEKHYVIPDPPSPYEFAVAYRTALEAAGWEILGDSHGTQAQLQAVYAKEGREIQIVLRLVEDTMAVSVADIGAQKTKR